MQATRRAKKSTRNLAIIIAIAAVLCLGLFSYLTHRARSEAETIQCANILSSLGLAARQYALDNHGVYAPDFRSLSNELNTMKVLICPSERMKSPGTNWSELVATSVSYEYLFPNQAAPDKLTNAIFRCPIHGHTVYADGRIVRGDGTVQYGKSQF